MYRILIVEDDEVIAQSVKKVLSQWNYEVECTHDFKDIVSQFVAFNPHLVLLDISLPYFNGYHWCQEIRRISQIPIIFLSSMSDNMNIVMAINMGGDDFISKPFDSNIMVAKTQALLRRTYAFGAQLNVIEHQGMILNLGDATLQYQNQKIELTKNEFKIIQLLLENRGKIVPREDIMECLWQSDSFIDDNTLTVNMTRLRKRLGELGLEQLIKTKKGIGYVVD